MASQLHLRVITPDRIVVDEQVDSVQLPATDGQMGVLPRHAPMVAALAAGLLRYKVGGQERALFVSDGFAEVDGESVRVVCEAGELAGEIDEKRAREAEKRARERLAQRGTLTGAAAIDELRAQAALQRALLRLRVLEYGSRERVRT